MNTYDWERSNPGCLVEKTQSKDSPLVSYQGSAVLLLLHQINLYGPFYG